MMFRGLFCVITCMAIAACTAGRRPAGATQVTAPIDPGTADKLVDEGCYRCLVEAFEIYESARLPEQKFSTALLIAMREKELALDATAWIEKARALASPERLMYVDMVAALPWTTVNTAPDFEQPRQTRQQLDEWLAFLKRPESNSILDRYALLAFTCVRQADVPADFDTGNFPILQYRLGLCGTAQRGQLDTVLAASPRFVEAGFFIARYELANGVTARARVSRALPLLLAAHEGLRDVPAISVTLGLLWQARNELARALTLYDESLVQRPSQRDALLGRTSVLSYLGRGDDAIASATRMIDLGTWYLGDAYYWRAWNLYNNGKLQPAADDVVEGKKLQASGELLTLSGMIAYDQQRRVDARADFEQAWATNRGNCPAQWYLGTINVDERTWAAARDMFASATGCYGNATLEAKAEAEQLPDDLSQEAREQQEQSYARRVADNERQEARSALNASLLSLQLRERDSAERFARIAVRHDLTRERAQEALARATSSTGSSTPPSTPDPSAPKPSTAATPASPQ